MPLKNYTPHTICIEKPDGTRLELPSLGVIRVGTHVKKLAEVDGVPISQVMYGPLEGVPENVELGDTLIVSMVTRDYAKQDRHPLWHCMLSPDSGPSAIRNEKGQIVAVKGLLAA